MGNKDFCLQDLITGFFSHVNLTRRQAATIESEFKSLRYVQIVMRAHWWQRYCNTLASYQSHDFAPFEATEAMREQGVSDALLCKACKVIVSPGLFGENTVVQWGVKDRGRLLEGSRGAAIGDVPICTGMAGVHNGYINPLKLIEIDNFGLEFKYRPLS